MTDPTTSFGSYRLIVEEEGKFISKSIVALGRTERPTIDQLQGYLPAFGLPVRGVEFALLWSADDDPEMNQPVLVASPSVTMKWADYSMSGNPDETFVDYLNRVNSVLSMGEPEDEVSVDVLRYVFNRSDMSPQESMNLIVRPPPANSIEYEQLISRPGEVFMLLLYVEKRLSYHLVSRHHDIIPLYEEIAAAQSEGRISTDWFDDWWAKLEPLQTSLLSNNSDRGFAPLVNDLDKELTDILPDNLRENGIANLKELVDIRNTIGHSTIRENGIANLKELVDIRNTIGHSTIYNGLDIEGKVIIAPHITKHTGKSNRETFTAHFDDETHQLIKSMIGNAHTFLEICAKVPPKARVAPIE